MKCTVRKWMMLPVVLAILLCAMLFGCREARADVATDTLEIRVGYSGMELKNYVSVGKYSWGELYENLPMYDQAYSYFQNGDVTWGSSNEKASITDPTYSAYLSENIDKFTEVVDSASGFLVRDILDYAHINFGDVYNLKFYVEDHQGIQAAFDRDSLFQTRYYFENFNGHAVYYDDDGNRVVDPELCWSYCQEVEPMLAIEDNWASFTEEFEHAEPDFEFMNTANRFRLLFGQTDPVETGSAKYSAKYVSCVYITLYGTPTYGETPELDGTYGTHTVEFEVTADNESVRDALSEVMDVNSTDENVLVIRGYKVTPDSFYSDKVTVEVEYEIVGEGPVSIQAGIGGMPFGASDSSGYDSSGNAVAATINNTGTAGGNTSGDQDTGGNTDKTDDQEKKSEDTSEDTQDKNSKNTEADQDASGAVAGVTNVTGGSGTGTSAGTGSGAATTSDAGNGSGAGISSGNASGNSAGDGNGSSLKNISEDSGQTVNIAQDQSTQGDQVALADGESGSHAGSKLGTYSLTGSAANQLASAVAAPVQETMKPDHAVTGVEVEDTTEIDLHDQRVRMAIIGLVCAGICVLGGVFQKLWYRRREKEVTTFQLCKIRLFQSYGSSADKKK